MDLVGFDKHCLIRPRKFEGRSQQKVPGQKTQNQKSSGKPGRMTVGKTKTSIPEEILCKVADRTADRIQERIEADRKRKSIRNVHKKK